MKGLWGSAGSQGGLGMQGIAGCQDPLCRDESSRCCGINWRFSTTGTRKS